MSVMGDGHYLTGDAPLCGQCGYKLGGEDFAFRERSGVWFHHDCGLQLGNEEIEARGLMLEQVSDDQGYLNTTPAGPDSAASFGHRLAADTDHHLMRERADGKRGLAGAAAEFNSTKNAVRAQFEKEQGVLHQVNEWRAGHGLELVPDWDTWKQMNKRVEAPLPTGPKKAGGCLKVFLFGLIVLLGLYFFVPILRMFGF